MKLLVIGNIGFELMAPYLRQRGIKTVLVSIAENDLNAEHADEAFAFYSPTEFRPLVDLAVAEKVDAVVSISGPDHLNRRDSMVKVCLEEEYAIPVLANPLEAATIATDKAKTKAWLRERGYPVTPGIEVDNMEEALRAAAQIGYPVVSKPTDLSGGAGMAVAASAAELLAETSVRFPVLIEKFIRGAEFSVEVLNFRGNALALSPVYKGFSDYRGLHPMERVRLAPAPIEPINAAKLRRLARRIVIDLDLQPTADIDFIWGREGPQVLEINPRFGGVTALSMASSGVKVYRALIDMLLGDWLPKNYKLRRDFAADLPVRCDLRPEQVQRLLGLNGVFRVKLQKLKETHGRIALCADSPDQLLQLTTLAGPICDTSADQYEELRSMLERTTPLPPVTVRN